MTPTDPVGATAPQDALARIAAEEAAARADLARARRRLAALGALRREIEAGAVPATASAMEVLQRLERDRTLVEARASMLVAARRARDAAVASRVAAAEEAEAALAEIARAREVELSDSGVSDATLRALRDRADRARRRLAPLVALATRPTERVDAPDAVVHALLAYSAGDRADAFVVALPVPHAVHGDWATRGDDVCLRLACRAAGAVGRLLIDIGATDAPVRYVALPGTGALAIQAWLGDSRPSSDVRARGARDLQAAFADARELAAAGLSMRVVEVAPAVLAAGQGAA